MARVSVLLVVTGTFSGCNGCHDMKQKSMIIGFIFGAWLGSHAVDRMESVDLNEKNIQLWKKKKKGVL